MPEDALPLPSRAEYAQALMTLLPRLSQPQLRMLRAHFQAPSATITTHDLALAAGFQNWKPVNMHYGLLGTHLRKALGSAGQLDGQKSFVFASFLPPTQLESGWRWAMHPPFREALHDLAWFDEQLLGGDVTDTEVLAAVEGSVIKRLIAHRHRENSLRLAKLDAARNADPEGKLRCEVPGCGFDFEATYGMIGIGYAEVHHLTPLASFLEETMTTLDDLSVVCANCHRMIHRGGECRELKTLLNKSAM